MVRYTITEPHPTVVKNHYVYAGRGGAGNYFRAPDTTPASGVSASPASPPASTTRFYSGRGGAGNMHAAPKPPAMSFDEEYRRRAHTEDNPVGHVGRGGAGNVYGHAATARSARKPSDASSHSSSSSGSRGSALLARLRKTVSQHH